MVEITAAAVKSLRDRTGAGMMDCKRALLEVGGDEERAIDLLRQRGAAKAAKRAGRSATEGAVRLAAGEGGAALVELSSETDFVARNQEFLDLGDRLAAFAVAADLADGEIVDGEALLGAAGAEGLRTELEDLRSRIGENVELRRCVRYAGAAGRTLGSYVHFGNRIGVIVELAGPADASPDADLAREVAMHVAAANPVGVSPDDIPEEERERERSVLTEQTRAEGKPEPIVERIVEGRMRKFYEQSTLLMQSFVKDPDVTIADLLARQGDDLTVSRFVRFEIGT
ncbi:MAG: translation elongation factor Ts [Gemmatimonadota bacterium]